MTRQTTRETTVQNQINSDHFEQLMASLMNKTDAIQNSIDRINKLDQASVFIPSIRPVTGSPEKKPSIFTAPSMIKPTVSQSFNQYNKATQRTTTTTTLPQVSVIYDDLSSPLICSRL